MKVYVVESGLYESKGVTGVYSTLERAMQANPPRAIPSDYIKRGKGDATRPGRLAEASIVAKLRQETRCYINPSKESELVDIIVEEMEK